MYKNSLDKFKKSFPNLSKEKLRKLYNFNFNLVNWADTVISENRCINNKKFFKNRHLPKSIAINRIRQKINGASFAVVLLCGGRATRFGETPKAIYKIKGLLNLHEPSFLKMNVLQVIKTEKELNIRVPIIIYTDCLSCDKIIKHLKDNNYFLKDSKDFYFVKQSMGLRYIPNKKLLISNGFKSTILNIKDDKYSKITEPFISTNIKDSMVGEGHFIFNSLINSSSFRLLIKNHPKINLLIVSNVDNLGQKYFTNIIGSGIKKNFVLVCRKRKEEKIYSVFMENNKLIIKPYFICKKNESNLGFTATTYLQIDDLLNIFGFKTKKEYFSSKEYRNVGNSYYLVLKKPIINGVKKTLVHFENSLSDISNFLSLDAIKVERKNAFHPFKESQDLNLAEIKLLNKALKKYNYI